MANSILTPTAVTREALDVLHQKLNFIGSIHRGYDKQFAKEGAKIGNTLNIRLPNQYQVRTGAVLSAQDTVETSVPIVVSTQRRAFLPREAAAPLVRLRSGVQSSPTAPFPARGR